MPREKILTLILAGGKGSRLGVLTKERAKPVMPFGGTHRLIDFALSNCMHSRLSDVWVIEQHELHSLNEHLSNGRPWDLDRTYGGLQVLPPYTSGADEDAEDDEARSGEGGFAEGNADAIHRHRRLIRDFAPDVLLVLSADHVYKLDYNDVIAEHLRREAEVTIVTKEIPVEEAARFGTVIADDEHRVTEFEYKPERPRSGVVTTEVFVYDAPLLLDTLDELASGGDGGAKLKDFGHELLPRLVERGRAYAYTFDGYWRDLGTIESYWQAHMDLLAEHPDLDLTERGWTIRTFNPQQLPARIRSAARINDSLVSPGCDVSGQVERSVLAPGVRVEEGARVRDSVILGDCTIRANAEVDFAIIDAGAEIGRGARVGAPRANNDRRIADEEITLVGRAARIEDDAAVEPGAQIAPRQES